ncbi:MAG: ABC transporter ATP-binding protein [Ktedonobacteraceae bacterium]|nr:ABC transporter ATP-binding protein [Ktedonobacteraceae bacterium]
MVTKIRTNTVLEVKNVSVDYMAANGAVHAVDNVSFTLNRGEIMGLAGESGSGKSTLAYAISRLLRPPAVITEGSVFYYPRAKEDGESFSPVTSTDIERNGRRKNSNAEIFADGGDRVDVLKLTPGQLRAFRWNELSIVFQSAMNALNPVMTVGRQIMDVLQTHRPSMGPDSRKQRAIELFRLMGISPDRLTSYPHELSGGMRQRAIIAIALALSPDIIIMDEPTTALDVVVQREILTEIIRLRENFDFSVIFITHDLSLLLELADRVAIMYAGRVVEMASQRDLYQHPRHPYSYGLLHSFPTLHGPRHRMIGIPGTPPDLRAVPPGCAFNPRCPFAFEQCKTIVPPLQSSAPDTPEQLVACHLYDSRYHETLPATADLAKGYEALAEGRKAR